MAPAKVSSLNLVRGAMIQYESSLTCDCCVVLCIVESPAVSEVQGVPQEDDPMEGWKDNQTADSADESETGDRAKTDKDMSPNPNCVEGHTEKQSSSKKLKCFKWSQLNDFFLSSNPTQIAMGGGGEGFAFALSSDLTLGTTCVSETFENEPLISSAASLKAHFEQEPFSIRNLEVWRFKDDVF